jgi:uncharacterized protein
VIARARALYFLLAVAALGLVTSANRLGARILQATGAENLLWLAGLCVPSLLVCLLAYVGIRPARPFALRQAGTRWGRLLRLGGAWLVLWLAGSGLAASVAGHWIRYTSGLLPVLCFLAVAPLQEELLYRGALFELAERGWPVAHRWAPVTASALPFALQHLQFHGYRWSGPAILQVAFTLPMGLVLGRLRQESGSIWPGWVVHVATNLAGAVGSGTPWIQS